MASFTDNCDRANNADIGAAYTVFTGLEPWRVVSNAIITASTANPCGEYRNDITFTDDYFIQGNLVDVDDLVGSDYGCGLCVYGSDAAETFYWVRYNATDGVELYEVAAGVYTSRDVDSAPVPATGNLVYVQVTMSGGTATISGRLLGTEYVSFADATPHTGRRAGFRGIGGNSFSGLDNLEGGDLVTATVDQEGFRWRNDDGSESSATWEAAQDANITLPANTPTRLRVLVNAAGDPPSAPYQLESRIKTTGTWQKVEA